MTNFEDVIYSNILRTKFTPLFFIAYVLYMRYEKESRIFFLKVLNINLNLQISVCMLKCYRKLFCSYTAKEKISIDKSITLPSVAY